MHPLGQTRTTIRIDHAFISPDSHVLSPLPGWTKTQAVILISPQMGAKFTQYLANMEPAGKAASCLTNVERFVYVLEGKMAIEIDDRTSHLDTGHYVYIPPNFTHHLQALQKSRLVVFERHYTPLPSTSPPRFVIGHTHDIDPQPFMDDPDAQLRTLLPDDLGFDMAVNLFSFQAGAALPFVESHVMEHGLILLEGQGIYRLSEQWYPVQAGDVIWMAPYCPQWFAAIGKTAATYLYYKDVNRDPLMTI
ncbi:MAG: (S)-ureidoglycine aminohydrolase [Chloroflexota bacterium]